MRLVMRLIWFWLVFYGPQLAVTEAYWPTIQAQPLSPDVKKINPNGVSALAKDVEYLAEFVDSLNVPILRENLDELQQTVQLMQADSADEFYDISTRNKKYGRVDAMQGPILLEKYGLESIYYRELPTN